MKKASLFIAVLAATLSSCTQVQNYGPISGSYSSMGVTDVNRSDCKMVLGRVVGKSTGYKLLGLITVKSPSEREAMENMYQSARDRQAPLEGHSRTFVNTSVEKVSTGAGIFTKTDLIMTGDVVEYTGNGNNVYQVQGGSSGSTGGGILSNIPIYGKLFN